MSRRNRAPAPYTSWGQFNVAHLNMGVDLKYLKRPGMLPADIAREVRVYCAKRGIVVPIQARKRGKK